MSNSFSEKHMRAVAEMADRDRQKSHPQEDPPLTRFCRLLKLLGIQASFGPSSYITPLPKLTQQQAKLIAMKEAGKL